MFRVPILKGAQDFTSEGKYSTFVRETFLHIDKHSVELIVPADALEVLPPEAKSRRVGNILLLSN